MTRSLTCVLVVIVLISGDHLAKADLVGYWSADSTGGQGDILVNDLGDTALDGELFDVEYTAAGGGHTGAATD